MCLVCRLHESCLTLIDGKTYNRGKIIEQNQSASEFKEMAASQGQCNSFFKTVFGLFLFVIVKNSTMGLMCIFPYFSLVLSAKMSKCHNSIFPKQNY